MKIYESKNTREREGEKIFMQNTELTSSAHKKKTHDFYGQWKLWRARESVTPHFFESNSELCRHVRDGSPMIGGHSTSPIGATLPWRRQRWTKKKSKLHNERISENFPLRLLLRCSELIYVRIRTCHIYLPLAMTAHTTYSSSTLRGILSDRFFKKKKNGKFVCVFVPMVDECHWTECDE